MVEIHRILVPTDFSTHADRALEYAVGLASLVGAKEILLFHVLEPAPTPVPLAGATAGAEAGRLEEWIRESALTALRDRAARIDSGELRVETFVMSGTPAASIAEVAGSEAVDLIVMGSRGLGGIAHVLFGSVAERTLAKASCPVLAVKASEGE